MGRMMLDASELVQAVNAAGRLGSRSKSRKKMGHSCRHVRTRSTEKTKHTVTLIP